MPNQSTEDLKSDRITVDTIKAEPKRRQSAPRASEVKMWAEDIVDYLAAAGIGTVGTDLYWGVLPDMPES